MATGVIEYVFDPPHPRVGYALTNKLLLFDALREPFKYVKNP